jgi:hypothetical protein
MLNLLAEIDEEILAHRGFNENHPTKAVLIHARDFVARTYNACAPDDEQVDLRLPVDEDDEDAEREESPEGYEDAESAGWSL